jgi:hypothetical protein
MKNYFIQIFGVILWGLLFIGVNGASFVQRSTDIWVTGCSYVESGTFVWKFSNNFTVGSLVETVLNLHLCNRIFYLIIVYGFFKVIYMCCVWLHYLHFLEHAWWLCFFLVSCHMCICVAHVKNIQIF